MILFWWSSLMLGGAVAAARGRDFTSPLRQSPSPTAEPTGTSDGYSMTFDPPPTLFLGENGTFQFTSSGAGTVREYSLILLQLPVGDSNNAASSFKVLDVQTGICITDVLGDDSCKGAALNITTQLMGSTHLFTQQITLRLDSTIDNKNTTLATLDNLFFCIGPMSSAQNVCDYYSSAFNLGVGGDNEQQPLASAVPFTSGMTIINTSPTPLLKIAGTTSTASSNGIATTVSPSITGTSLTTTTQMTTASSTSSTSANPSVSHSTSKLSTGAKVGIALGALAFIFLLLLLALFFLRKKHVSRKQRAQPEQVMLTRDMHQDSFSRNLMMLEKDRNPSSTIAGIDTPPLISETPNPNTQRESTLPIQRHSIFNPSPSTTAAAGTSTGIPRRKPTNSTILTSSPPTSPVGTSNIPSRSGTTGSSDTRTPPDTFEAYHDVPIYGDARHVPQVFNTVPERGVVGHGSASPFLSEEGMSAEEMARLEEEEARIDAAIAAAERDRGAH